jgi:glycosyltransferase involved in cell wall biosynthesis
MRVAIDVRYVDGKGSGIGTYSLNLVRTLLEEDPTLEFLLVLRNRQVERLFQHPRIKTIVFPAPPNSLRTRFMLGRLLAKQDFDVYHSLFAVAPEGLDRPLIVTAHDIMWLVNPRFISHNSVHRFFVGAFYRSAFAAAIQKADRVLAGTEATRAAIVDHFPWVAAKTRVTSYAVNEEIIHPLDPAEAWQRLGDIVPRSTPFVLTVGNNSPHKNHINALRGFLKAFADRPEYRMILIRRFLRRGDNEMAELMATEQAKRQVIALPHVSADVLNALYNSAAMLLHPSYYEGFGIPLIEAMSTRTPVVTSTTSCLPEVAADAAALVDPADCDAIAAALRRIADDSAYRDGLAERGDERWRTYTWKRVAQGTLDVYREFQ